MSFRFPANLQTHPFWLQIPGESSVVAVHCLKPATSRLFAFLPCVNADSVEIRRRETVNILWPMSNRRRLEPAPPMNSVRGDGVVEQNILKEENIR